MKHLTCTSWKISVSCGKFSISELSYLISISNLLLQCINDFQINSWVVFYNDKGASPLPLLFIFACLVSQYFLCHLEFFRINYVYQCTLIIRFQRQLRACMKIESGGLIPGHKLTLPKMWSCVSSGKPYLFNCCNQTVTFNIT